MAKVYEHQVGSTFVRRGLIYQVMESASCFGCSFLYEDENVCTIDRAPDAEMCSSSIRKDGKSVIFVQVGEVPESE